MKQALSLAKLALGQVSPNPAVGAVVVSHDEVVGQGYTQPPGITEVHLAMLDPNPQVLGRGREELERKGIKTYVGEHEEEAKQVNEAYTKFITTGVPFVTAKFAISLDGKIATKSGDSKWISSEVARKRVHNLRHTTDAIMAGVNTVLIDDPELTARSCGGRGGAARAQPLRVIVDSKGRTPLTARVFSAPGKTLLVLARLVKPEDKKTFAQADVELLELPSAEGLVNLKKLLKVLGEQEITSVLVEGGGILLGSLFAV